jgi:nicotinic acid mononucleotide adenylyltransferase
MAVLAIHGSPAMGVLHVTGGGISSLQWLLAIPGASSTVIDATIPYSVHALRDVLRQGSRKPPSSAASAATAAALAAAAYATAAARATTGVPVFGVGATCAIRSTYSLRGDHRAHVCVRTDTSRVQFNLVLDKTAERSRIQEDCLVSRLVIQALLNACRPTLPSLSSQPMCLVRDHFKGGDSLAPPFVLEVSDPVDAVLASCNAVSSIDLDDERVEKGICDIPVSVRVAEMQPTGQWRLGAVSARALLPGSFNPVHKGHRRLLAAAREYLPSDTVFGYEISISNPDKPALDADAVRTRAAQFVATSKSSAAASREVLVLTIESLFAGKAALLPGTTFIIGYDTAVRIVDSKYYDGETAMIEALLNIARNQCSFLVAGRRSSPTDGTFLTLAQVNVPPGFESLFESIPEGVFREDVSSTQLRAKKKT